jgi:hypothetical protein
MITKPEILNPMQILRDNPEKIQTILEVVPKAETEMVEKSIKLALEMDSIWKEVKEKRVNRIANAIDQLKKEAEKKIEATKAMLSFPKFIQIQLGLDTSNQMAGFVDNRPYIAGYYKATLGVSVIFQTIPVMYIEDGGSVFFIFPLGLREGMYSISLDWMAPFAKFDLDIKCYSHAIPHTAIDPWGHVDRVTTRPTHFVSGSSIDWGSLDMTWEVKAANSYLQLGVKNNSGDVIGSFGVDLVGFIW